MSEMYYVLLESRGTQKLVAKEDILLCCSHYAQIIIHILVLTVRDTLQAIRNGVSTQKYPV